MALFEKGNIAAKKVDFRTLKLPCGVPRAAEAEELLCTAIMHFHVEVIETPVFVISQILSLLVITLMSNNHTVSLHTASGE